MDATAVLSTAREFAQDVLRPAAMEVELRRQIPPAHLDGLAALGLYGLAGPVEYGGLEADFATACEVIEILASGCLSTAFVWLQHQGPVRAVTASGDARLREQWLRPLCEGTRRAGVALAGAMPGPPGLRARPVPGGYVFDGFSPWVTGWGLIDTLYTAARDDSDNVVWALLDAKPGAALSVEPVEMVAVMASQTVRVNLHKYYVPAECVTNAIPLSEWQLIDASGQRANGSLALGIAARCCAMIGPSSLDDELASAREALDAGTPQTMPAARGAAAELALRAAAALVVAQGSRAILADSEPQRLAREAVFLLVFASRPAIKESLLGLLTG
jgi:alkylation response protein AidB-like acyl-CoA dehydrogenase